MLVGKDEGNDIKIIATYQSDTGSFLLFNNDGEEICQYVPVLDIIQEYEPNNFDFHILHNDRTDYGENCIYQVLVQGRHRIGWIFPIQCLESKEHDYSGNNHFLKYAYVALVHLLNRGCSIAEGKIGEIVKLSDFYNMDETVLLVDKTNTRKIDGFDFDYYVVSLFAHGYSFTGNGNLYNSCEGVEDKHLALKPLSEQLRDSYYIVQLYKDIIPVAQDTISKFFVGYQMIEIMIAKIFNVEFNIILDKMKKAGLDVDLFKIKDDLIDKTSEAKRIKELLSSCTVVDSVDKEALKLKCNKMLSLYGRSKCDDTAKSLYEVRCMIAHRCYILNKDGIEILEDINDTLYGIIYQMAISFKMQ